VNLFKILKKKKNLNKGMLVIYSGYYILLLLVLHEFVHKRQFASYFPIFFNINVMTCYKLLSIYILIYILITMYLFCYRFELHSYENITSPLPSSECDIGPPPMEAPPPPPESLFYDINEII